MTEIVLPDPCLVLLLGAAGAGKSTFAARHFAPGEVLSSDAYRGLIAGDPADQGATRAAFAALHRDLRRRLRGGLTCVVDATNVQGRARRRLFREAREAAVPVVAIVLDLPADVVLARNRARARPVPDDAVMRQLGDLRRSLEGPGGLAAEGCREIVVLRDPDAVDGLVVRRPGRPA